MQRFFPYVSKIPPRPLNSRAKKIQLRALLHQRGVSIGASKVIAHNIACKGANNVRENVQKYVFGKDKIITRLIVLHIDTRV